MSAETFYFVENILAGLGWFVLIVLSPFWKSADKFLIYVIIVALALLYTDLNGAHMADVGGPLSFLSFDGVMKIFANPYLAMAGWAHILALDLFVGIWIRNDAAKCKIKYGVVVPVLLLTIAFAPLGLLVYLAVRWGKSGKTVPIEI